MRWFTQGLLATVTECQLSFLGHIMRLDKTAHEIISPNALPHGQSRPGRPHQLFTRCSTGSILIPVPQNGNCQICSGQGKLEGTHSRSVITRVATHQKLKNSLTFHRPLNNFHWLCIRWIIKKTHVYICSSFFVGHQYSSLHFRPLYALHRILWAGK